jgi:hypothetical protein
LWRTNVHGFHGPPLPMNLHFHEHVFILSLIFINTVVSQLHYLLVIHEFTSPPIGKILNIDPPQNLNDFTCSNSLGNSSKQYICYKHSSRVKDKISHAFPMVCLCVYVRHFLWLLFLYEFLA